MSKNFWVELFRSSPIIYTANMKLPEVLVVRVKGSGCICCSEVEDENIISFFAVLRPSLAKRIMNIIRMDIDTSPPVAVPYSASPLYLRKLVF